VVPPTGSERGITPRIARRGKESSARLGRHRWVVERAMSWLAGCRCLHRRYERKPERFLAFTAIATISQKDPLVHPEDGLFFVVGFEQGNGPAVVSGGRGSTVPVVVRLIHLRIDKRLRQSRHRRGLRSTGRAPFR
jgi:hypothetical protein